MLPAEIAEFINMPGQAVSFGSSDTNLQPKVGRGIAVKTGREGTRISVLVPKSMFEPHQQNLERNKNVSLTITYPPTHKSMQFKGQFEGLGELGGSELETTKTNISTFHQILIQFYGQDAADQYLKYDTKDLVHVNIKVNEVYDQTPGPGAGKKVFPN